MNDLLPSKEDFWETLEVSLRFLQEGSNSTGSNSTGNSTNPEDELIPPNDSVVLRETLKVYGSIFAVCFFLFCILRKQYPKKFNVRSWVPELDCPLAHQKLGFISWIWQVRLATDDEIREQCGLDALCFLRMLVFGYKLSLVGLFNSIWLFPLYATTESQETAYIDDRVAQLTVSYLPSGSLRFVGTVVATYIVFFYSMYLILKEYKWFTYHRHCYLSALKPRNYSVYVANIPKELQSSRKLLAYFMDCFNGDCVLQADVALKIPKLEKTVAKRDSTVLKLEHLINIEKVKGKKPMRRSLNPNEPPQDAITATIHDLNDLNTQVVNEIAAIEAMWKKTPGGDDASLAGQSYASHSLAGGQSVHSALTGGGQSVHSGLTGGGYSMTSLMGNNGGSSFKASGKAGTSKKSVTGNGKGTSMKSVTTGDGLTKTIAVNSGEAASVVKAATTTSMTSKGDSDDDEFDDVEFDLGKSNHTSGSENILGSIHKSIEGGVSNAVSSGMGLASTAVSKLLGGEEGEARSGGFITFKKLRSRQAALQMIHDATPFVMDVSEGPDPDTILWGNVGKSNKEIQVGTLISFSLTCLLCLFWTIPVSFIASLTSVESLSQQLPFLQSWLEAAPWLGSLLEVLAPLILVGVNAILPTILEIFSKLEMPVSEGIVGAATFAKLSAFMIIQTFFVSAISGSIWEELSNIAKQPTLAIDLLATSLPAQSTYFIQILLVSTFIGLSVELLRISPFCKAICRRMIGPNLTKEERQRTILGFLRPLNDPLDFLHPEIGSNNVLYFMIFFVYTALAPLVNWFLFFCFLLLNSCYRYEFFCNYPATPDSGGKMWISFIRTVQFSMIVAQLTLFGYLALKRTALAIPLLVPLLAMNLVFQWYISQKHNLVATFLPSHEAIGVDRNNNAAGEMDYGFLKDQYLQPQLKAKDEVLPDNLSLALEVEHGNDTYETPPGSEADIEDIEERSSLVPSEAVISSVK